MRLLAIETATADCSVALALGNNVLQVFAAPDLQKPSEQVPGLIRRLLAETGITLGSLDAIAFDSGPGAFTGIRIGCGLAQGMALGADLPLVGLCSLRVLAMQAPEGRVLAMLDARMSEVYWALFERAIWGAEPGARAMSDPRVEPPSAWVCPTGVDSAVGDGLAACPEIEVAVVSSAARPRAVDMLPLARADLRAGLATPPEQASPLYVRDRVALTAAEQLARRVAR
jgi:tRNA threonylcarbamoyladenosine biosynthesis protein TsaB